MNLEQFKGKLDNLIDDFDQNFDEDYSATSSFMFDVINTLCDLVDMCDAEQMLLEEQGYAMGKSEYDEHSIWNKTQLGVE